MKTKFRKRLVATVLTLCMVSSVLIPMATVSYSAAISAASFDAWRTNTLYTRGLSVAGEILNNLGEATGDAHVMQITSFINGTVCGNSNETAQIKAVCDEILAVEKDMQDVVKEINADNKNEMIYQSGKEYGDAWTAQVMNVMKSGDGNESFYGVYDAYLDYLKCANEPEQKLNGKTLEAYEEAYVSELESYYSHLNKDYYNDNCILDNNDYSEYKMYTTGAVDRGISSIISSILYNMNPEKTTLCDTGNLGYRFVDKAAQYAYYAFPYSDEQAEFIDMSVEHQVNLVTTLVMIYQDFLARRADYYLELNHIYNSFIANEEEIDEASLSDSDKAIYQKLKKINDDISKSSTKKAKYDDAVDDIRINYSTTERCDSTFNEYYDAKGNTNDYVGMLEKYQSNIDKFINGEIRLNKVNANTTLDKYVRDDATNGTYSLKNNNFKQSYKYDGNVGSQAKVSGSRNDFYKNASVKAEGGELVFRPFYVLNGETQNLSLSEFDILKKCGNGTIFGGVFNAHYLSMDYQNFRNASYTDGMNKYVPVSDPNQLKSLINETYYTANGCTPQSYFAPYMQYANGKTNYLILSGKTVEHDPIEGVRYEEIPVFNMKSTKAYSNSWNTEYIDYEDFSGAVYSLILVPQSTQTKSKVDAKIDGVGEVKVSNNTPLAGDTVQITVDAPENSRILGITVQYHNDLANPSKVTSEKEICTGIDTNEYTLNYRVPYTNTTVVVKTVETPQSLPTDEYGN